MKNIFEWLNNNSGLATWVMAVVAVAALIYAIKEFFLKRRPLIDVEIQVMENPDKQKGGWLFFGLLVNKGTYPAIARVSKTIIRVGDEEYPSEIKNFIFITPGEGKKTALIGSIYQEGIKKILGHEYRLNRAEIEIEIQSGEIGTKKFKYFTRAIYQVHIGGEEPTFTLVEEEFK